MIKAFYIEIKKTKGRGIWLIIMALWIIQSIYLLYANQKNIGDKQGWLMLLYQLPLLNSILLPTAIAILASRIIDLEHKGNMLKLLETIQSKGNILNGKLILGLLCIVTSSVLQLISAFLIGSYAEFKGSPDILSYIRYLSFTIAVSFILYLIQVVLSLIFQNQAVAFCVGLCGSMTGLFILFFKRSLLYEIIPWGLYGASSFVGMNWDSETRFTDFYYTKPMTGFEAALALWLVLLIFIANKLFSKMESDGFSICIFQKSKAFKNDNGVTFSHLPIECIKLKRTPIWLAFIVIPAISAVIGTFNYLGNISILKDMWYSLWSQHTLFLCYFFMPALIGVYCSLLWRMEHMGTSWNQLMVNTYAWKIAADKLMTSAFMVFITMLWIFILYIICGKYAGINVPLPPELSEWLLCGFAGGIAICAVQSFLSLVIRNFALPIGAALVGGIAGLMFTSRGMWYMLPYSLLSLGMRANNPYFEINFKTFFAACGVFIVVFYLLSVIYISKKDVMTQN